jgi:hypothetical protein
MDVDARSRVYVFDAAAGRVLQFVRSGPTLSLRRSVIVRVHANSMCVLDGDMYFLGLDNDNTVHEYNENGQLVRSFGTPDSVPTPLEEHALLSGGRIVCLPHDKMVVVGVSLMPTLRAFTAAGVERWAYTIPDFHRAPVRVFPDGSITYSIHGATIDLVGSLIDLGGRALGVQVMRGGRQDQRSHRPWSLETVLLSTTSGGRIGLADSLQPITTAADGKLIVVDNTKSPQITVLSYHLATDVHDDQ